MPPKKKKAKKAKKGTTMSQNVKQSVVVHVHSKTTRRQPKRTNDRSQPMSRIQTPQFVGTIGQDNNTYEKQSTVVSQAIDNVLKDNILKLKNYPENYQNYENRFNAIEDKMTNAGISISKALSNLYLKNAPNYEPPIVQKEFVEQPTISEVSRLPKVPSTIPSTIPSTKPTKKVKIAKNTIYNYIKGGKLTSRVATEPVSVPVSVPVSEPETPKKRGRPKGVKNKPKS